MAAFALAHLGSNVIAVDRTERVVITNTSDQTAFVFVHLKHGSAWRQIGEPVILAPGWCWSAKRAELGSGLVLVLVQGKDDGRNIVRVEY